MSTSLKKLLDILESKPEHERIVTISDVEALMGVPRHKANDTLYRLTQKGCMNKVESRGQNGATENKYQYVDSDLTRPLSKPSSPRKSKDKPKKSSKKLAVRKAVLDIPDDLPKDKKSLKQLRENLANAVADVMAFLDDLDTVIGG